VSIYSHFFFVPLLSFFSWFIPDYFRCVENILESLIQTIHPNIPNIPIHFSEYILLSANNKNVHVINTSILNDFLGNEHVHCSADSVGPDDGNEDFQHFYPVEHLNFMNTSGLPLALKKGCPVMVLKNLNPNQGACNGVWGILT
jgi:hypothetical protein